MCHLPSRCSCRVSAATVAAACRASRLQALLYFFVTLDAAFDAWKAPTGVTGCAFSPAAGCGGAGLAGFAGAEPPFPLAMLRILVRPTTASYQNGEPSPINRPPRRRYRMTLKSEGT